MNFFEFVLSLIGLGLMLLGARSATQIAREFLARWRAKSKEAAK